MLEECAVFLRALSIAVPEELAKEGIVEEGELLRRANAAAERMVTTTGAIRSTISA
jgi:hypothetical protein